MNWSVLDTLKVNGDIAIMISVLLYCNYYCKGRLIQGFSGVEHYGIVCLLSDWCGCETLNFIYSCCHLKCDEVCTK